MSKKSLNTESTAKWKVILKSAVIGIIVTAVLMFIFSFIIMYGQLDRAYASAIATVCIAFGTLTAAYFAAKSIGEKGYAVGMLTALIFFIIVTVIGFAINGNNFSINTLFHFIIMLLSGLIGGILGVSKKQKRKYI